jgi:hypothetical protein
MMMIMDGTGWRATSVRTDPVGVAVRVMTAKVGRAHGAGHQANRPVVEGVGHTWSADATITSG